MRTQFFHFLQRTFVSVAVSAVFTMASGSVSAQTPFSQDSAYAYLKVLAGTIGARPMGSPAERAAMNYAVAQFRSFGLDEAFVLSMREAISSTLGSGVNTNSGIAVGVLKGATDRVIVIGGHIDSADPDIPGANDDGSGSAAVIELARVLKQRNNQSTIVFALFGGEEQGLRGSRYFVKHFDRMEQVALMLQIDMTNGSDWLLPLVNAGSGDTPEWLVRASFEELANLGHTGLSFPTHFYTMLEILPGGGIGSDHEPFLEKGIPAIDFTSDVTDAIHTPQDNLENFIPSGLKRSGDLVYKLVERFDGGVPEEKTGSYYLYQIGSFLFFIPLPALTVFLVVAFALSVFALLKLRERRIPEEPRRKIPGLKLFLLMLIIQACVWLSENVVGLIAGRRFPWVSEPDGYFVLGFLAAVAGTWISLRITPHLDMTHSAYRYALRAVIFLSIFMGGLGLISIKLALYPATALFLLGAAFFFRHQYARLLLWLISAHFMFRLVFSEGFYLFARTIAQAPAEGMAGFYLHIFYILFFSLWSFPFLLGFAAIRSDEPSGLPWLGAFGRPIGGIASGGAFLLCAIYLSTVPAYSDLWQQQISIRQSINLDTNNGMAEVTSPDFLGGAVVNVAGKDSLIEGRETRLKLASFPARNYEWITAERTIETTRDSNTTFNVRLSVRTKYKPYSLTVTYAGGSKALENITTPLVWSPGTNSVSFRWYSFPDTSIYLPVSFAVIGSDSVREYIEATFLEQAVPVTVRKELSTVSSRTIVTRNVTLGPGLK
ncbi:MAG: M28 family metallopeptidase [Bacteroidota bacterium]